MQAGVYASVLHYLKAVDKVGGADDGKAVVAAMKAMPTDDPLFGKGTIRADGRKIHPMYLFQVKTPQESKGDWDYFKLLATIPPEQAFRPMSEGNCPLVKKVSRARFQRIRERPAADRGTAVRGLLLCCQGN